MELCIKLVIETSLFNYGLFISDDKKPILYNRLQNC